MHTVVPGEPRPVAGMPARAELIVVTSGKGGVGKSNLAVNLGIQLARRGLRTILLDADLGHANVDILLDIAPRADLLGLLDPRRRIEDLLTVRAGNLSVVCGVSPLRHGHQSCDTDPWSCAAALHRLRRAGDVLLVDCDGGVGGSAAAFALACDCLLLITTPEPTAIAETYAALKLVCQRGFCARAAVLVNMARSAAEAADTVRRLQRVAQQFLGFFLENLGYVPFDRHVPEAVRQRRPFVLRYPRCPAAAATAAAACRLHPTGVTARPVSLWGRVASLFI